jgi:hypothetical protein
VNRLTLALFAGCALAAVIAVQASDEAAPGAALDEEAKQREQQEEVEPQESSEDDPALIAATLEQALSSRFHTFCRSDKHELLPDERALCGFAADARERCPQFAAACERAAAPKEPDDSGSLLFLKELLRLLGFFLFWGALAALAALGIGLLLRVLRANDSTDATDDTRGQGPDTPGPDLKGTDRDVNVHLGRCRALAERGQYAEALLELQLAVVLSLDARGLIHARRGRTNGDYARELRSEAELGAAFREVTNSTEAVHFGGRSIDASAFQRVMDRALPLLSSLALVLSLLSFAGCSEAPELYRASNACGTRADGYSVLCSLLELSGEVRRRYRPLDEIEEDVSRIIVLPNSLDESSWAALVAWVERGGIAVLTTKAESIDARFGVLRDGAYCGNQAFLGETARLVTFGRALGNPPIEPAAVCSSGEFYAASTALGAGRIVFLPAPELLSNASFAAGENARLLLLMMPTEGDRTDVVGSWTGTASSSPFASMNAAQLWPWLVHLMVLGFAFARFRGAPFGRRVPPQSNQRRRFSEHVAALGQRWQDAGASRTALAAYSAWAFEVLRERVPSGAERGIAELSRVISTKTGLSDDDVARTLARARLAQAEPQGDNEKGDLDTLRRLGRLLTDMGGPR